MLLTVDAAEIPLKAVSREAGERLLVEAAQKDPSRFGDLYENNFERVYAYVARRLRNRDAAEDVTAEVFHSALRNLGSYQWRGVPFAAWLLRIAANTISDRWHRAARERGNAASEEPAREDGNPEEGEERARLFRLVQKLPDVQRRVIEMRFAEEKSIREIALALRKTEGAIKQLQFRALTELRARIVKKPGEANG
jgi:RNA polymerase sigma-70 factor, ECF subfamily